LVRDFGLIADLLGRRMGCFLFQLPPSFHYTPARLKRILSQLDHGRATSWNSGTRAGGMRRCTRLSGKQVQSFVLAAGPRLPDELIKTADDIYIRFHGVRKWYRHNYTIE
jgi:uncharacterized protein YecE (DUF72 family)